jgi:hypothetical protein
MCTDDGFFFWGDAVSAKNLNLNLKGRIPASPWKTEIGKRNHYIFHNFYDHL